MQTAGLDPKLNLQPLRAALGERCSDVVLVDVPAQLQKVLEGSHIAALFEILPSLQDAEKKYGHAVC